MQINLPTRRASFSSPKWLFKSKGSILCARDSFLNRSDSQVRQAGRQAGRQAERERPGWKANPSPLLPSLPSPLSPLPLARSLARSHARGAASEARPFIQPGFSVASVFGRARSASLARSLAQASVSLSLDLLSASIRCARSSSIASFPRVMVK